MQAVSRADGAHVFRRQLLPGRDIRGGEEGAAVAVLHLLNGGQVIVGIAQRLFHGADILDHLRKFFRLHGKGAVRAAVRAAQGQMLLDHPRAQGDRGGGYGVSHGMVGKAGEAAEGTAQGGHHVQMDVLIGGGIGGDAFHQKHVFVSFLPAGREGAFDIPQVGHSRRQDHGLMQAGDPADEGDVGDLIGGHFVGGHVHGRHEIHRRGIEGGGKAFHSQPVRFLHQLRLPLPGSISLLVQPVEGGSVPDGSLVDLKIGGIAVQGDGVRGIGLQLDGIRSGFPRRMDDLQGSVVVLEMVGRHFRHDEDRTVFPYGAGADGKRSIHEASLLPRDFSAEIPPHPTGLWL